MVRNDRPLFPVLKEGMEAPAAVVCLTSMAQLYEEFGCAVVCGGYLKTRGKRTSREMASPPGAPWPLFGGRCDLGRPVHPVTNALGVRCIQGLASTT